MSKWALLQELFPVSFGSDTANKQKSNKGE